MVNNNGITTVLQIIYKSILFVVRILSIQCMYSIIILYGLSAVGKISIEKSKEATNTEEKNVDKEKKKRRSQKPETVMVLAPMI